MGYINKESHAKVNGEKWVVSFSVDFKADSTSSPLKGYDHKKSGVYINAFKPHTDEDKMAFRLSVPQFKALSSAVIEAQNNATKESMGWQKNNPQYLFYWDIVDACADPFTRIFGEPNESGMMFVRKLSLKRIPVRKNKNGDFEKSNAPWQIVIVYGLGKGIKNKIGGTYMKERSFVENQRICLYLSDGDMREAVEYSDVVVENYKHALMKSMLCANPDYKTSLESLCKEYSVSGPGVLAYKEPDIPFAV